MAKLTATDAGLVVTAGVLAGLLIGARYPTYTPGFLQAAQASRGLGVISLLGLAGLRLMRHLQQPVATPWFFLAVIMSASGPLCAYTSCIASREQPSLHHRAVLIGNATIPLAEASLSCMSFLFASPLVAMSSVHALSLTAASAAVFPRYEILRTLYVTFIGLVTDILINSVSGGAMFYSGIGFALLPVAGIIVANAAAITPELAARVSHLVVFAVSLATAACATVYAYAASGQMDDALAAVVTPVLAFLLGALSLLLCPQFQQLEIM